MPINRKTSLGQIRISDSAIADGYSALLKKENYSKGVVVKNENNGIKIDVDVVISYGVKISEVVGQLQERVKYALEKSLNMDVDSVNVHIEGIQVNE